MGTHVRTRRREVGGGDAHTQTGRCRTTRRPDSHCFLFLRAPPLFPPFLPLHCAGMPKINDGQRCAHPACSKQYRDVKVGNDYATVNDWAGKGKRFGTCPTTGYEQLNLRDKPTSWVTVDNRSSTLLGSDLYDEQMRLHKSCGHTDATAEKETRQV